MPSKERAGGKELEIMKSISTQGGRRPGSFASRMPTQISQVRDRISLIGRKRRASIHCDLVPWCGEISAIKQRARRPYSADQRAT